MEGKSIKLSQPLTLSHIGKLKISTEALSIVFPFLNLNNYRNSWFIKKCAPLRRVYP